MSKPSKPHSQRSTHTQLPSGAEIMHISDAEEQRPLLRQKTDVHYINFDAIKRLYEYFKIDSTIFSNSELTAQQILDSGAEQVKALSEMIIKKDLSKTEIELLMSVYDYLAEEDVPKKSDYIYVFGAKTPFRIEKAIELYKKGLAPRLILSGRGPYYGPKVRSEAEQYAETAVEAGVPEQVILIESASITIPDNVRRTLNLMDAQDLKYSSFIIINSPYTQRRGWAVWKKHTPDNVAIYRVNCAVGPNYTKTNWYKNEDGLAVVLGEYIKLRNALTFNDV